MRSSPDEQQSAPPDVVIAVITISALVCVILIIAVCYLMYRKGWVPCHRFCLLAWHMFIVYVCCFVVFIVFFDYNAHIHHRPIFINMIPDVPTYCSEAHFEAFWRGGASLNLQHFGRNSATHWCCCGGTYHYAISPIILIMSVSIDQS